MVLWRIFFVNIHMWGGNRISCSFKKILQAKDYQEPFILRVLRSHAWRNVQLFLKKLSTVTETCKYSTKDLDGFCDLELVHSSREPFRNLYFKRVLWRNISNAWFFKEFSTVNEVQMWKTWQYEISEGFLWPKSVNYKPRTVQEPLFVVVHSKYWVLIACAELMQT